MTKEKSKVPSLTAPAVCSGSNSTVRTSIPGYRTARLDRACGTRLEATDAQTPAVRRAVTPF